MRISKIFNASLLAIIARKGEIGSPFYFGVKNAETLAITGFESVLNMKHAKMLRMLLKT